MWKFPVLKHPTLLHTQTTILILLSYKTNMQTPMFLSYRNYIIFPHNLLRWLFLTMLFHIQWQYSLVWYVVVCWLSETRCHCSASSQGAVHQVWGSQSPLPPCTAGVPLHYSTGQLWHAPWDVSLCTHPAQWDAYSARSHGEGRKGRRGEGGGRGLGSNNYCGNIKVPAPTRQNEVREHQVSVGVGTPLPRKQL